MKKIQNSSTVETAKLPAAQSPFRATMRSFLAGRAGILWCAALLLVTIGSASAQTTNVFNITNSITPITPTVNSMVVASASTNKARLTIPVNMTGQLSSTNWGLGSSNSATTLNVNISGSTNSVVSVTNFVDPDYFITNTYDISLSVASVGVTDAPAGVGVVLPISITNNATVNATIAVPVTLYYTNVASGIYDMTVDVAGVSTWRYPLPVIAGFQWTTNDATAANGTNFAAGDNWLGGVAPSAATDIVILENTGRATGITNPTVIVGIDTEIGALRDIHNQNNTHINVADGATLKITGSGGYQQAVDFITGTAGSFHASGLGGLLISNANATFWGGSSSAMFLTNLNNLKIDVKKIAYNDIASYPNVVTNGINNSPNNSSDLWLAKTNILRATHTDLNNWTNDYREYSFAISRTANGGSGRVSPGVRFGSWNEMYVDSILFGGYHNSTAAQFAATNSYLKIAGPNYTDRCKNLTIGDKLNPMIPGLLVTANSTATVNFTGSTSDALIDNLILARNARVVENAAAGAVLNLGLGTWDVNNAILGYQTGPVDGTEGGGANGRLTVSGGVFKVNDTMTLGWTETNSPPVTYTASDVSYGRFTVQSGGTALINKIEVGGPANASYKNYVTITNVGSTLVLSNSMGAVTVGGSTNRVSILDISSGGTLVLAGLTAPGVTNVYATVVQGSGGVISLPNVTSSGTYIVASYETGAPITWTLSLPGGFYGFLVVDSTEKLVKAIVSTTPPKTCVWVGNVSGDWDTTTLNWKELVSGNPTNFAQGDAVLFDDSASNATVNVALTVIPSGGTTITNDTLNYSFSGSTIDGTAATVKSGSGSLTLGNTHSPSLTVNTNGSLVVNGTLNGGLTFRGTTAINNGTINGAVAVQNNGSLLNNNTITTTPGALTLTAGCSLTNSATGTIYNGSSSNTDWPAGTTVVNEGKVYNLTSRIVMRGMWFNRGGTVGIFGTVTAANGRLQMQNTAQLFIEDSNIGGMTVETRFDLIAGSRVYIDYDRAAVTNSDYVSVDFFGDMLGTFVMNNIGATPPALGDVFTVMRSNFGLPLTNSNPANVAQVSPKVVDVGVVFDASGTRVTTTNGGPSAVRNIVVAPVITSPLPTMTSTNNGNGTLTFNWNANYLSYVLLTQTNNLDVGLSNKWYTIPNSHLTNNYPVSIDTNNPSVFFRLSNTNAP